MANNVVLHAAGGSKRVEDNVNTVADAKARLGLDSTYTAFVNGEAATDSTQLHDSDFVTFSKSVKGGV